MAIHVTTSNIKSFPLQPMDAVRARIERAARFPGINFGQELHPTARGRLESETWRYIMASHNKDTYGMVAEVPISLPHVWDVQASHVFKLTDAVRGEHAPARYLTVVEAVKKAGDIPVAFVNMHPEQKPNVDETHHLLWEHYAAQAIDHIRRLSNDYNVVYGGDLNTHAFPQRPYYRVGLCLVRHGLDGLYLRLHQDWSLNVIRNKVIPPNRFMDHAILNVTFDLTRHGK